MAASREIDYSSLYAIHDPLANRPMRLRTEQDWADTRAYKLYSGEWLPPEPLRLRAYMGNSVADFLWSGFVAIACISQRIVDLLQQNHFTGWSTYPVVVFDRKGRPVPGYHGFAVKSYAGARDLTRSPIITNPPPVAGGKPWRAYKGMYFDEGKWDGSDIFRVDGRTVTTRAVRDAFVRAKVTNVRFTALAEEETDVIIYEILRREEDAR